MRSGSTPGSRRPIRPAHRHHHLQRQRLRHDQSAQERRYDGRVIDTVLKNPDFVAYAKAFGAHAEKLDGPGEIADALRAARTRTGPSLYQLDIALAPPFH